MTAPRGYLDLDAAADSLGMKRDTVRRYACDGRIKAERFGCSYFFRPSDLAQFAKERRGPGRPRKDVKR